MLVIVNVALLSMVGQRRWHNEQNRRETRERVVAMLEKNGIAYSPAEVPEELELQGCRLTLSPLGETEAGELVGQLIDIETIGPRTLYTGADGTLSALTTGELTVEFSQNSGLTEEQVLERLSRLGVTLRRQSESAGVVTCAQLYQEVAVPGETARLTLDENGKARLLTLRRLAGTEEPLAKEEMLDGATALARFLEALNREGYVCSRVTDLYAGYAVTGSGTVTLRPTWYVETDTGPWRFAVDGVTGTVTAAE